VLSGRSSPSPARTTIRPMSQPDDVAVGDDALHPDKRRRRRRQLLGIVMVVCIALLAGFLAWLLLVRGDDDSSNAAPATPPAAVPEIASVARLRALADSGETFYWAGTRSGTRIELTVTDGTVFVRYLPVGEEAGSSSPALTVATYPRANGFDEVSRAAEGENVSTIELPRGGLAVVDETTGTNVHLAYPDQPYQAEVYSPQAGLARTLVANGTVRTFS
jgi:hypothetical protein